MMYKRILFVISLCFLLSSCTTNKIYTKLYPTENRKVYTNPLIVIPSNSVTEYSSGKIKKNLEDIFLEKNLKATVHILEVKPKELKLNEKEISIFEEVAPIYENNKNDVFILFKYDEYNYGGYGASFTQDVIVVDNTLVDGKGEVIWTSKGFATYDGIKSYCVKIVNKLVLDGVLSRP